MSGSKTKSATTRRRPSKSKFLKRYEIMEGSGSPRDPSSVLSSVLKKLWPKQKPAVLFTLKRKCTFLDMETGTGKTLTTLASLAWRHLRGNVDLVLVVCPAAAVHVWRREINKWIPGTTLRFAIVSYDLARFYFKYLRKEDFDAVVFDEVHRLKNPNSGQGRRCAKISAPIRYGLTGTPIADSVIDLFSQYRSVAPHLLGTDWVEFRNRYLHRSGYMGYDLSISEENKIKVLNIVGPDTYQLTKAEAFPGRKLLPPVYLYANLKGTQKKLYEQLERDMMATHDDFVITAPRKITQMIRLQQISGGHCPSNDGDMLTFECPKADALKEFLEGWNRKKKLVIFARFLHEIDLIETICKKLKYSCEVYTPKRPDLEDRFQNDEDPSIFITQIDRGGIALTLHRASTAIFFSKTWSSLTYWQALGRIDRGGQTEPVTPIFILTQGTIDEDIEDGINEKMGEADFVTFFFKRLLTKLSG